MSLLVGALDGFAGDVAGIFIPGMSGIALAGALGELDGVCGVVGMFIPGILMPGIFIFWSCAHEGDGTTTAASAAGHSNVQARCLNAIKERLSPEIRQPVPMMEHAGIANPYYSQLLWDCGRDNAVTARLHMKNAPPTARRMVVEAVAHGAMRKAEGF